MTETITGSAGITLTNGNAVSIGSASTIASPHGAYGAYISGAGNIQGGAGVALFTGTAAATLVTQGLIIAGEGGLGGYSFGTVTGTLGTYRRGTGGQGGTGGVAVDVAGSLTLTNAAGTIVGGAGGAGNTPPGHYAATVSAVPGLGGRGGDAVIGGAGSSVTNFGLITGGAGGKGGSTLGSYSGGMAVYLTSGYLLNGGTIAGGTGIVMADAVSFAGISTLAVEPGAVFAGSVVAADGSTLVLGGDTPGTLNLAGTFSGFSNIDFAPGATWTLEGVTSELLSGETLTGFAAGDQIILSGVSLATQTYVPYMGLILNDTLTLAIADTGYGLNAIGLGSSLGVMTDSQIIRTVSTSISRSVSFTGTLLSITTDGALTVNAGSAGISGHVALTTAEIYTLANGGNGAVGVSGESASIAIINAGIVAGGSGGAGGYGYGQYIFSGLGGAGGAAIIDSYPALVDNTGVILGGKGGNGAHGYAAVVGIIVYRNGGPGAAAGAGGDAIFSQASLTLTNTGTIAGGNGGNGGAGGAGAVLYNSDVRSHYYGPDGREGNAGAGGAAVIAGAESILFNQGLIAGGNLGHGSEVYHNGSGIILAGGIITNAGTIAGGMNASDTASTSISFTAYGTIIADPGAVFIGGITANAGAYLQLTNGTAGSLNLAGITSIALAPTAAWTLSGSTTEFFDNETISGFTQADTIDIAHVTVTSDVFANNTLTLFNGATLAGTLDLPGVSIPPGDTFLAYADGHAGTDIVLLLPETATLATGSAAAAPVITLGDTLSIAAGATITNPVIASGGTLDLNVGSTVTGTIFFSGPGGRLIIDGAVPHNTITGFTIGDALELSGVLYSVHDTVTVTSPGTVEITANGTIYNFNIAGATAADRFSLGGDLLLTEIACFCPGTRIATARGSQKIETLRIGDLIKTTTAGMQPIKWIGTRTYAAPFCNTLKTLPIRIAAGALGPKMPSRDLYISPGHALSLDGHLVQAGRLINATSITQLPHAESVTYYHIELATHALILAENCPAETFLGEEFRAQFHNAPDYHRLYPGTCAPQPPCQPYVRDGFELFSLQRRLAWRAGVVMPLHTTGPLRGCLDEAGPVLLRGWAQDVSAPEHPVSLTIMAGSTYAGQVLANSYREDLYRAGLGSGHHAFEFSLPPSCTVPITLRRSADGAPLPDATRHAA